MDINNIPLFIGIEMHRQTRYEEKTKKRITTTHRILR